MRVATRRVLNFIKKINALRSPDLSTLFKVKKPMAELIVDTVTVQRVA